MEEGVVGLRGKHLIIRTAAFFSPFDTYNFASAVASTLSRGDRFRAAHDLVVTPTYVPYLVGTALDLLIDEETGVWHLTNEAPLSWAAFAARIAERLELPDGMLQPVRGAELGYHAERPAFAALQTVRGSPLLSIDAALADFASHYAPSPDRTLGHLSSQTADKPGLAHSGDRAVAQSRRVSPNI